MTSTPSLCHNLVPSLEAWDEENMRDVLALFYAPMDYESGSGNTYYHGVGHIEGTINEDMTELSSLIATKTFKRYEYGEWAYEFYDSLSVGTPIDCREGIPGNFWVQDLATCDHIDIFLKNGTDGINTNHICEIGCDESSELNIGFGGGGF